MSKTVTQCKEVQFKIPYKQMTILANTIVNGQKARVQIAKKLAKLSVKFKFGMRSKTKYGSKALTNFLRSARDSIAPYLTRNTCRAVAITGVATATTLCTDTIFDMLSQYSDPREIFPFIDLGFRVTSYGGFEFALGESPSPDDGRFTEVFAVNLALFGATLVADWTAYLVTPLGSKIITALINRNPVGLMKMLTHASIFGTRTSDVVHFFWKFHNPPCTPESFGQALNRLEGLENAVISFIINRAIYEAIGFGSGAFYTYIANYDFSM